MLKNVKLVVKTSIFVTLYLVIGFVWLWKIVDNESSTLVENTITNQMDDAVESRAYIISNFVENAEEYLVAFSKSEEVLNLLKDTGNAEAQKEAQEYTLEYAEVKGIFEGLYIADYDMNTLTHINTATIGMQLREGDRLKAFQDTTLAKTELTNSGIIKSPNSGEMVMPLYYPVYDNGKCLGFVGAAVYASKLMDSLNELALEGLTESEYIFLNVENGEYLYNKDEALLCTVTENAGYIQMLDKIKANPSVLCDSHKYIDESGKVQMVMYRYIPERNWVFAIRDTEDNIFGSLVNIRRTTGVTFLIMGLITIAILVLTLSVIGKHLGKITAAIQQLGRMDLSADKALSSYSDRGDEIGIICKALNVTCSNLRRYIGEVDTLLSTMADGDFSRCGAMDFEGDFVTLQRSLEKIQGALSISFRDINTITSELVLGSESVENSANNLANAATTASSLISEIDSNVEDITIQLGETSDAALTAKSEAKDAADTVLLSKTKMEELSAALHQIEESASAVESISATMEKIAKQTNILSLNALVEATRAGESGKGFAVVASEIRVLAEQSGQASLNAYELIAQAISSVEQGLKIGDEASECLEQVVDKTNVIDARVSQIADATVAQNEMLQNIKKSLGTISQTVETTAAMAEQSAAASSELDGQINALKDNINQFNV